MGAFLAGCRTVLALAALGAALAAAGRPAEAVEYRLVIASLHETAFTSFLGPGALADGASSPGLDRLEASMDRGELSRGVILYDRPFRPVPEHVARAFGAVPVKAEVAAASDGRQWSEVRWEGTPGTRSVWAMTETGIRYQEVRHLALKGTGSLRYLIPYGASGDGRRLEAVAFPLNLLWYWEERGSVWDRRLSKVLDVSQGLAALAGLNPNPIFMDHIYLVVDHADRPTTYKAVLAWGRRPIDFGNSESPGGARQ